MGNGVVRVYQEEWFPFQNLPAALARFGSETGIRTELSWDSVGVGTIEHMFEQMLGSFTSDQPAYDLICCDEIILRDMARQGRVVDLAPLMKRDGVTLDNVTEATRGAVTRGEAVLGLPCINVSSMVLYRRDLFERYRLSIPSNWDELKETATALQDAVRRDEDREFYGFETRGAPGGGHAVWTIGTFLGSFGARWLEPDGTVSPITDAHRTALRTYLDLLWSVCPPDQGAISFVEMRRDFAGDRVGMIMDVGMEYAHVLANQPDLADKAGVAIVPAGPAGRAPNLYTPPWAIPIGSDMTEEAWALAKYLTSDAQLIEDGEKSAAIEASSLPALYSSAFDRTFRDDILSTARASRAVARLERPLSDAGMRANEIVGNTVHAAFERRVDPDEALDRIAAELDALIAST